MRTITTAAVVVVLITFPLTKSVVCLLMFLLLFEESLKYSRRLELAILRGTSVELPLDRAGGGVGIVRGCSI
jgi:hypothetical protein